jgi:thiamine pyrophosphate-dependent acetolactate synthase large subunit-like protein
LPARLVGREKRKEKREKRKEKREKRKEKREKRKEKREKEKKQNLANMCEQLIKKTSISVHDAHAPGLNEAKIVYMYR